MPTKDEILSFSLLIEKKASDLRCSHIDAILEYCKETGLEIEVASSMISAKRATFYVLSDLKKPLKFK